MLPCTRLQSSPLCTRRTCQWSCRRRSRDGSEIQQPATAKCRFTDTVVAVFVFVFLICFQWRIQMGPGSHDPLEAHVPTLPLQKSVESKAGKRDFKDT